MTRIELIAAGLIVLTAFMLWLFVVAPSYASGAVQFEACKSTTCEAVSATGTGMQGYSGVVSVQANEIVRIAALHKCDHCVAIVDRQGRSIHVVGTLRGIACKVWGGQQCADEMEGK